jgi:hypothetical protein
VFCVTKLDMGNDLFYFIKEVLFIKEEKNEVTIQLELKELLEKNKKITIQMNCEGKLIKEIILKKEEK